MDLDEVTYRHLNREYKPDSVYDILALSKNQKHKIKSYAKDMMSGDVREPKCMLLSGKEGCGKTATVYALSNDLDADVVEINGSVDRTEDKIQDILDRCVYNAPLPHNVSGDTRGVIVLIDEIDGIYNQMNRSGGVTRVIRELVESKLVPVFMTANDSYGAKRSLESLSSYIEEVKYDSISTEEIRAFLTKINRNEGWGLSKSEILKISKSADGDMRVLFKLLSVSDRDNIVAVASVNITIFEILDSLFGRDSTEDCIDKIERSEYDIGHVISWLSQNISTFTNNYRVVNDIYDVLSRYEYMARRPNQYLGEENVIRLIVGAFKDVINGRDKGGRWYNKPVDYRVYGKSKKANNMYEELADIFDGYDDFGSFRDNVSFMREAFQLDNEYRLRRIREIYNHVKSNYDDKKSKNRFKELVSFLFYDSFQSSNKSEELWEKMVEGKGSDLVRSEDKETKSETGSQTDLFELNNVVTEEDFKP